MADETAAAREDRDLGHAESDRVARDYESQAAERLARLYVDGDGANAAFDTDVSTSTIGVHTVLT